MRKLEKPKKANLKEKLQLAINLFNSRANWRYKVIGEKEVVAFVFVLCNALALLVQRNIIVSINFIYNTCYCGWYLFSFIVYNESSFWFFCAFWYIKDQAGKIISRCLGKICFWYSKELQPILLPLPPYNNILQQNSNAYAANLPNYYLYLYQPPQYLQQ